MQIISSDSSLEFIILSIIPVILHYCIIYMSFSNMTLSLLVSSPQDDVVSTQTIHAPSGFYGQQQHYFNANHPQQPQPLPNSLPVNNSGYLNQVPQHDFSGHNNIGCAPYPYYGGMTGAYGAPTIPPQSLDVPTRVPLAPETGLEPVFVNPKQYHAILRRRKLRAKAKNEKKLIKGRKTYVHESCHLHAVNRPRGIGGRFTKSEEDDSLKTTTSYSSTRVSSETLSGEYANLQNYHASLGNHFMSSDIEDLLNISSPNQV